MELPDNQLQQNVTDSVDQTTVGQDGVSQPPVKQSETDVGIEASVFEQPGNAKKRANNVKSARWKKADKIFNVLLWVAIALLASLVLIRAFVTTSIAVDGHSMDNTFQNGEVLWINKLAKPQRGQVAVFFRNDIDSKFLSLFGTKEDNDRNGKYAKLIKRVVAVEGDLVWVEQTDQNVYELHILTPQGEELKEDYYSKYGEPLDPIVIKSEGVSTGLGLLSAHIGRDNAMAIHPGYFFAMGDHRENSADSRTIGEVPFDRVVGVMIE